VHITKSTDSGGQPQAFRRLRNGVSRLRQPGLVRCLWLPRQVSIRMVCLGVFDDPGVDRSDEAVGARLDMVGQHPRLLGVEGLLVEVGEHARRLEARTADLLDLLDGGAAQLAHGHGRFLPRT